jgi:hypothetical protein
MLCRVYFGSQKLFCASFLSLLLCFTCGDLHFPELNQNQMKIWKTSFSPSCLDCFILEFRSEKKRPIWILAKIGSEIQFSIGSLALKSSFVIPPPISDPFDLDAYHDFLVLSACSKEVGVSIESWESLHEKKLEYICAWSTVMKSEERGAFEKHLTYIYRDYYDFGNEIMEVFKLLNITAGYVVKNECL